MSDQEPEHAAHGIPEQVVDGLRESIQEARESGVPEPLMATLEEVIKSPARSKTIGLNAGLMLLLLIPQVKDFVSNNPVSVPYALAAANIVLRFSTSGRISLFPGTAAGKTMGGSSWWLPVIIGVAGLAVFWTEALPGLVG